MPKVITTTVFEYYELSAKAQEAARTWWREGADTNDWAPDVTADLKQCAALMGWNITSTGFSGFSSQGDGAHFEGTWSAWDTNIGKLEAHAPRVTEANERLHAIAQQFAMIAQSNHSARATVRHTGHYQHSGCTEFIDEFNDSDSVEFRTMARSLMDWYYRALERAYDEYTSDASVAETISANEYTFTAEGKRFG